MPTPTASLRLQVIERIIVVLQAITAGADYWAAPYEVAKRLIPLEECKSYPTYMIYTGSGGSGAALSGAPDNYDETLRVWVEGWVKSETDIVAAIEHSIQDIRKAVNLDYKSKVSGTLGALNADTVMYGPVETDEGVLSADGFGWFRIPVDVTINGDMGVL